MREQNRRKYSQISKKITKRAPAYNNKTEKYNDCLEEKIAIITLPDANKVLYKRSEIISKCKHENTFLLRYLTIET